MIKTLTVREAFEKASGFGDNRGFKGFPLAAFPVGHKINVNSPLVLVIGDNGSGKSTFLDKLAGQFAGLGMNHWYMDIECDKQGETEVVWKYESDHDPLSDDRTLSHGEHAFHNIPRFLAETRRYKAGDVLYFDEPENGISLRNKRRLVDVISDYAFSKKKTNFCCNP
jgi:predicted ATPase